MAHLIRLSVFFFFFFFFTVTLSLPTALLAPVSKDPTTLQYTSTIYLKTPLDPTKLLLDLGASFTWLDCQTNHSSSSYLPIPCNSSLCASLHSLSCTNCYNTPGPGCSNDSCALFPENPVTRQATIAQPLLDEFALPYTDGRNPGRLTSISNFTLSCSPTQLISGLADGVSGLAALGRSNSSLPAQVSTLLSSPHVFALCLSGSPSAPGVAFFGTPGPYFFLPEKDLSKSLVYTPLLLNPISNTVISYPGLPSDEYFIEIRAVKVNGKAVPINDTLLSIDAKGVGGTKISIVEPYTKMESSIHVAFVEAFVREAAGLNFTVTKPVEPFKICFPLDEVEMTRVGPGVPTVDLVMDRDDVFWRVFGGNSMVRMVGGGGEELWCLAFVDGGPKARTSIVIGGYQMEENLVQFDVDQKRIGFSSTLLLQQTMCGNFNFTSNE